MRGTVLAFDWQRGEGQISGEDGARYRFAGSEWQGNRRPAPRQTVDFIAAGDAAVQIFPTGAPLLLPTDRNRVTAALLAIFLGMVGAHKFYLGQGVAGVVMMLISLAGLALAAIPTAIMWLIALVEAVIYLSLSEQRFDERYVNGRRAWF